MSRRTDEEAGVPHKSDSCGERAGDRAPPKALAGHGPRRARGPLGGDPCGCVRPSPGSPITGRVPRSLARARRVGDAPDVAGLAAGALFAGLTDGKRLRTCVIDSLAFAFQPGDTVILDALPPARRPRPRCRSPGAPHVRGGGLRGAAIRTGPDPAREIRKASGCFVSAGRRSVGRTALAPASAPRTATPRMPSAGVVSRCVKRPAARPAVPARSSCAGRQGTAEKIRARARVCGEFMGRAGRTDRRRPPRRIDSSCAG